MKLGNIMIFGDSYSTYEGYIPEGFEVYYSGHRQKAPDIFDVKETWWGRVIEATGATLVQNNSWSGSTIGYTGWHGKDCSHSSSFIYRFETLLKEGFFERNKIDTLFVFGGTNDSWSQAPLGELKGEDIKESELFCVLPAISYFATRLAKELPNTKVVFIGNCGIKSEITDAISNACKKYGFCYVALADIDKSHGHPTELGMKQISEQVLAAIK